MDYEERSVLESEYVKLDREYAKFKKKFIDDKSIIEKIIVYLAIIMIGVSIIPAMIIIGIFMTILNIIPLITILMLVIWENAIPICAVIILYFVYAYFK